MPDTDWLPPLEFAPGHGHDLNPYIERLYDFFKRDFLDGRPLFLDRRVGQLRRPEWRGKSHTFWHLVTRGRVEERRRLDFPRCERIRWPKPILEAAAEGRVVYWRNQRRGRKRLVVSLPDYSYIVVLDERPDRKHGRGSYLSLHTAYPVAEAHSRRKLRQEHERELARQAAPHNA